MTSGDAAPVASAVPAALRADEVRAGYRGAVVVEDASVRLRAGRVTALIGPNGSGKSTLLRTMAALHPAMAGRVTVDGDRAGDGTGGGMGGGTSVRDLAPRELARRVTLLSQARPTPGGVTVREVVEYGRHPHRPRWGSGDAEGPEVVRRVMEMTGVTELALRPVNSLSGGQLQRVWLASCLAQDTPVLLLDEPTTFLDLRYQVELLDIVRDLADRDGIAVGLVLHDLDQAAAVADDVVLLVDGRVAAAGPPATVMTPELLTRAYGIDVDVSRHPVSGLIHTRARARHHDRLGAPLP
ncbi:ABC transporter ATP-binding protein [Streptomyces sp. 4N509B]|uniref:ABC transporter ATP-binding protein n=1 Tax=Streptomyces sp. 4N509B TaxID=3457413 RepID=UPI003FCF9ADA